jgi:hypothetical protein
MNLSQSVGALKTGFSILMQLDLLNEFNKPSLELNEGIVCQLQCFY